MNRFFLLILILIPLFYLNSCEYSSNDEVFVCDTVNVSYKKDIVPILSNNCYRCHSNQNSTIFGDGVDLEGYKEDSTLISAGLILCNVKRVNGCKAMPKGAPKLPDCDIAKIQSWFNHGYPNN